MASISIPQSHSYTTAATPFRRAVAALTRTSDSLALTVLRIALAVVIFAHGAQKLFGWFGGYGFEGTMQFFTGTLGIPYVLGVIAIVVEIAGPVALVAGLGTRIAALGVAANMAVAVATVHLQHGFFMNWSGQQAGEGFELHLALAAMAFALVIAGSGALSLDRRIAAKNG